MTEFASVNDPGFKAVCGELRRWIKMAAVVTHPQALPDRSRGGPQDADERTSEAKVGWTARIRGVPRDWDADKLQAFLTQQQGFRSQDSSLGPTVRSLLDDIARRSKVGTATFQDVLPALQTSSQWTITLPPSAAAQLPRPIRQSCLTLDHNFPPMPQTGLVPWPEYFIRKSAMTPTWIWVSSLGPIHYRMRLRGRPVQLSIQDTH